VNSDVSLLNNEGLRVRGEIYDDWGNMGETLSDILVDQSSMVPPSIDTEVEMVLNLDASETPSSFYITDPGATFEYSTALTIYDSLDEGHALTLYFTKTGDHTWEWYATIDGFDVQVGGSLGCNPLGPRQMVFTISGLLSSMMPIAIKTGAKTFTNGIAAPDLELGLSGATH
jgi:flagellar hook protein FlgE